MSHHTLINHNLDAVACIARVQAAEGVLTARGLASTSSGLLNCATRSSGDLVAKLPAFLTALEQPPINLDAAVVVTAVPNLMWLDDIAAVLQPRVAAIQQLHPQLDVERVVRGQPTLLSLPEATLAGNWAALQLSSGLDADGMRRAVEQESSCLAANPGVACWKVQQGSAYETARGAAGFWEGSHAGFKPAQAAFCGSLAGVAVVLPQHNRTLPVWRRIVGENGRREVCRVEP